MCPLPPHCWATRILKHWDRCNAQINIGERETHASVSRFLTRILDLVKPNLNRKMVNQQHQQSIGAANEKGRQRCQLEVGDSDVTGLSRGSEVALRTDCQQDRSTDVGGAGGTRDYLALTYPPVEANGSWGHWHRHCWGQPTRSGQHTTSANPTECSTQCGWYSSRDFHGRSTGDGSCSHTYSSRPSWSNSSQSYGPWVAVPPESAQGTTETRSLNYFSVFLRNCRLLDTVSRFSCFLEIVS